MYENKKEVKFFHQGLGVSTGAITWEKITPKGSVPSARYKFVSGYNSQTNKLYVYGGLSQTGEVLGDFWIYDVGTNTWTEITGTKGDPLPPALSAGAGVVFKGNFYLIGGEFAAGYLGNTFKYDDATNTWTQWVIFEPIIGASIFNWGDEFIYYFGGIWSANTGLGFSDDLYVYDGPQSQWFSVVVAQSPPGRAFTSMVHAPAPYNRTFVFGGQANDSTPLLDTWFMFDTGLFEEKTWYEVPKQYYPWPSARFGAFLEYDTSSEHVILFGGGNSTSNNYNDLWAFDFRNEVWNPLTVKGQSPPGRMLGSISTTPNGFLIFGGLGGSTKQPEALNDIWLLSGL
eukprot:Phypoly_transcript_11764.p1 GENE.Phypoly_transcript_11764~~Phypoly_transcript_11764.p1  ORF type:complete len:342 (+),score=51.12 Phypoly_transcript_11764:98-1123(+)